VRLGTLLLQEHIGDQNLTQRQTFHAGRGSGRFAVYGRGQDLLKTLETGLQQMEIIVAGPRLHLAKRIPTPAKRAIVPPSSFDSRTEESTSFPKRNRDRDTVVSGGMK